MVPSWESSQEFLYLWRLTGPPIQLDLIVQMVELCPIPAALCRDDGGTVCANEGMQVLVGKGDLERAAEPTESVRAHLDCPLPVSCPFLCWLTRKLARCQASHINYDGQHLHLVLAEAV